MLSIIHDISETMEFLPTRPPFWQTWGFWLLLITCAACLTLAYFFIKLKKPLPHHQTPLTKAQEELNALSKTNLPPHIIASEISLILRRYLETTFNDPVLFETQSEFTLRPNALQDLPNAPRSQIIHLLTQLSQLKYAPHQSIDPAPLISQALQLLPSLSPRPN